jgi:hypothetical protein
MNQHQCGRAAIAMSADSYHEKYHEKAARSSGFTGFADAIAKVALKTQLPPRSPDVRLPELDMVEKADLFLQNFGWRYALDGMQIPSVADMARLFDLISHRLMTWKDAVDYLALEKQMASVRELTQQEITSLELDAAERAERERIAKADWAEARRCEPPV